MVLVSHPTGNENVSAVVSALYEKELLAAFYTCIFWRPESAWAKVVPGGLRATLERRARLNLPSELVRTRPALEIARNLILKTGKTHLIASDSHPLSLDGVYRDLDRKVARSLRKYRGLRGIYAYEDGAAYQFAAAKELGIHCIYDLPIGHWREVRRLFLEESELQPAWAGAVKMVADSEAKLASKDRELELADTILVASSYTRKTLELYPGKLKKVVVIPYGTPAPTKVTRTLTDTSKPLRVLYVGSLQQRKGISYLFEAVNLLGTAVTLTVIGRKVGVSAALDENCAKHRWLESVPHREVLAEMSRHDVLVFPSLFEGFGLVIGEALSQGLPVITTTHTGGPDILRDGEDGFIVPIRDPEAIAARLTRLREDRELLLRMSEAARARAGELSWQGYKDATVTAVREAIGLL